MSTVFAAHWSSNVVSLSRQLMGFTVSAAPKWFQHVGLSMSFDLWPFGMIWHDPIT